MPRQVTHSGGGLNLCADKVPKRATLSWPSLTGHFLARAAKDGPRDVTPRQMGFSRSRVKSADDVRAEPGALPRKCSYFVLDELL